MGKRKNKEEVKAIRLEKGNKDPGMGWSNYWDVYHEVEADLEFLKCIAEMCRTICGNGTLEEIAREEGMWRIFEDAKKRLNKIGQFNDKTFTYIKSLKEQVEITSLEG